MTERSALIYGFLGGHGWQGAARSPLPGDASFRRYERLTLGGRKAMLMDAPPPHENVDAFVAVARHLKSLGFSAPDIFAKDKINGFLIIEDLGDETFTNALTPDNETALYELGVDVLIELHGVETARVMPPGIEDYDDAKLLGEAMLLVDWALDDVSDEARRSYRDAWLDAIGGLKDQPPTLVLRDYHVDNLMRLDGRQGIARCGLLDFQDAVRGPRAYDLMSLLEDARRDVGTDLKDAMLERYLTAFGDIDREGFTAAFAILAAQRHAKVIGIFNRLNRRDAKPGYLAHLPRVWRMLDRAITHPALTPVADWIDSHAAADKRGIPA